MTQTTGIHRRALLIQPPDLDVIDMSAPDDKDLQYDQHTPDLSMSYASTTVHYHPISTLRSSRFRGNAR